MDKLAGEWYAVKNDGTLAGQRVNRGQLVQPQGFVNDAVIYGDNTHWTHRYRGNAPETCDTDGCGAMFDCRANLNRHRDLIHKPTWEDRERRRLATLENAAGRELRPGEAVVPGETTLGGHEITKVKRGPGGSVPYLDGGIG